MNESQLHLYNYSLKYLTLTDINGIREKKTLYRVQEKKKSIVL